MSDQRVAEMEYTMLVSVRHWQERAESAEASSRKLWQPMESVPKDGRTVILSVPKSPFVIAARWVYSGWRIAGTWVYANTKVGRPTKWMPVPERPDDELAPAASRAAAPGREDEH